LILGTHQGPLALKLSSPDKITAFLPKPVFDPTRIPIDSKAKCINSVLSQYEIPFGMETKTATVLSLGNPHCVFTVPDIQAVNLHEIAAKIEASHLFPEGVNIGIMQILAKNHIKLRVFERGAGETLACGSGACAAVISGIQNKVLSTEVQVDMPGGQALVNWPEPMGPVHLSGETKCVFDGFFILKNQPNFSLMLQKNSV
jgi:diaminopimelate epimerase